MGANAMRCDPPMELREIQRIVRSACRYERGESVDDLPDIRRPGGGEKPESERGEEKQLAKQGEGEAEETKEVTLAKDGRGRVLQTTNNARIAIESDEMLDGRLWYNTMGYTRMVTCPVPWDMREGVREITDEDYTGLVMYLERKYDLTKKERIIDAAQFVCRQYERNPVTEWLDSLEWDGLYRVGSLIIAALGATDNEYNRAVERLFMLGAVSRAYELGILRA
jgi:predicted P-loop ATPase